MTGHLVLRLAQSRLPQTRYGDFAETVAGYLDDVKRLAENRRQTAELQAKMLTAHVYRLAADPQRIKGTPVILKPVPHFDFAPLENAVNRLKISAGHFDAALAANGERLPASMIDRLFDLQRETDQALAPDAGLPGRPWYKNLIYAPGHLTGYSAKTLPAIREAIEEERWKDVNRYAAITATALNAYADRLDAGSALIVKAAQSSQTQ